MLTLTANLPNRFQVQKICRNSDSQIPVVGFPLYQQKHDVRRYRIGERNGIVVAGGNEQGNCQDQLDFPTNIFVDSDLTQLSAPNGLFVDALGTVYVADCWNRRVMRWIKGAKEGEIIVGGNGDGQQPNHVSYPVSLSFDGDGNLYVVENEHHRVQRFSIETS